MITKQLLSSCYKTPEIQLCHPHINMRILIHTALIPFSCKHFKHVKGINSYVLEHLVTGNITFDTKTTAGH